MSPVYFPCQLIEVRRTQEEQFGTLALYFIPQPEWQAGG